MNTPVSDILKAGSQVQNTSHLTNLEVIIPKLLNSEQPLQNLGYDTLMSICFELGRIRGFQEQRAFQMILEQVDDPNWAITLIDSFNQHKDIQNMDLEDLKSL